MSEGEGYDVSRQWVFGFLVGLWTGSVGMLLGEAIGWFVAGVGR